MGNWKFDIDDDDYFYDEDDEFEGELLYPVNSENRKKRYYVNPRNISNNFIKEMTMNDKMYTSTYNVNDIDSYVKPLYDNYVAEHEFVNGTQVGIYLSPPLTVFKFITELKKFLNPEKTETIYHFTSLIEIKDDKIFFVISSNDNNMMNSFAVNPNFGLDLTIYSEYETVKKIYTTLRRKYVSNTPSVSWLFRDSDGSLQQSEFKLKSPGKIYQEYYPYIPDVETYAKKFLESSANILVLLGPPGTGKTSFIRDMLISLDESALTTYDEGVMESDKLYIRFLNSGRKFIILEDADTLLLDRERDNNHVMSKILNASDGLVSINDKKFIFTANIVDEDRIDHALTRPGRCYQVLHFRNLTNEEGEAAAAKIGTELPHDGEISLAEIFNQRKDTGRKEKLKFGFGR